MNTTPDLTPALGYAALRSPLAYAAVAELWPGLDPARALYQVAGLAEDLTRVNPPDRWGYAREWIAARQRPHYEVVIATGDRPPAEFVTRDVRLFDSLDAAVADVAGLPVDAGHAMIDVVYHDGRGGWYLRAYRIKDEGWRADGRALADVRDLLPVGQVSRELDARRDAR